MKERTVNRIVDWTILLLFVVILFALVFDASSAGAQSVCGERDKFLSTLQKSYSEAPTAMGLVANGSVLEVLASENGTWTIIVTQPNGLSCVVASGEAWQAGLLEREHPGT